MKAMESDTALILSHLLGAALAGAAIGLERTYHGRPAGFRTHTLVCMASSLLMLLTIFQLKLLPQLPLESVRVDPTRMAQGIMTGIGFLGAGVIMKEGLSVRGLTTAASIWVTAAIGILVGVGFYLPAIIATVLTLVTLSLFRWLESTMPTLSYARLRARFTRRHTMSEKALEALIARHDITTSSYSYHLASGGKHFEYEMTIRAEEPAHFHKLAQALSATRQVVEFSITPTGEK